MEYIMPKDEVRYSSMIRHISTSIDGLLEMSDSQLKKMCNCVKDAEGNHPTLYEFKKYLMDEKAQGHRLIRSDNCDNFDPVRGCLGHPRKDGEQE